MQRHQDWMKQAVSDLKHAKNSLIAGDFEWSCFAAHQAAEKAIKSLYQRLHLDAWGHTLSILLANLPYEIGVSTELIEKGKILDKHYIISRYPNGFNEGAPTDFYTRNEAEESIRLAEEIIEYCKSKIN
ncbi:MAG: HEPN domain-containing protein [Candidatus Hydrogenedentota bacterium]